MWRVLCVDDDQQKARDVGEYLSEWRNGNDVGEFHVTTESSFDRAVERIRTERFDLVTLDLHGATDPPPEKDDGLHEQEGRRILDVIKSECFLPVVFYTGFADKIKGLESSVVRIVKKGDNDLESVRAAVGKIFSTGLPELSAQILKDKRDFMWEVIDKQSDLVQESADLAYLLARRLAARFSAVSVKEVLGDKVGSAKPIELYIYPPVPDAIHTGCILKDDDGFWIVATPACDFAQNRADHVVLLSAVPIFEHPIYLKWMDSKSAKNTEAVRRLTVNNAGDRYKFLPGTFFIDDLVVDFQGIKRVERANFDVTKVVCRLDSPFREDLLGSFSRYYGRIGVPEIDITKSVARIAI